MESGTGADLLAEKLEKFRADESRASKRRVVLVMVPLLLGILALIIYAKQLSASLEKEHEARLLAVERGNAANRERERADELNKQLQTLVAGLQSQQEKVPEKIAASSTCARNVQKGDELQASRRLEDAEKAYNQALECQKQLLEKYSDDNELQFQLSITYNSVGSVRLALNNPAGALAAFEEALKIREKLASVRNAETRWKRGKFNSLLYMSEAAARAGDSSRALLRAQQALSFVNDLSGGKANAGWDTELSLANEQLKRLQSVAKD